jgi:hypothetical protein
MGKAARAVRADAEITLARMKGDDVAIAVYAVGIAGQGYVENTAGS